uniref:Uncharacterized protein n=1 Tax=uncultured Desulfobacterium sp. TaxID=201089 RepID=E1Y9N9_9BACT|nr:unknown protein [uncultured Desulfobacterium sp.]
MHETTEGFLLDHTYTYYDAICINKIYSVLKHDQNLQQVSPILPINL